MLEDGTNATESNWRSRFEQLPIGSVVTLEGGTKKLMIYGRLQRKEEGEKVWDYLACPWPEGNLDPDHSYLFDAIDVERVYFVGFVSPDETEYTDKLYAISATDKTTKERVGD